MSILERQFEIMIDGKMLNELYLLARVICIDLYIIH